MTVRELGDRLSSREEIQWRLLENIDPWGQRREDYRAALIAQMIVNVHKKPSQQVKIEKFLLEFKRKETGRAEPKSPDSLMDKFKRLTANLKPESVSNGNDRDANRKTETGRERVQ